MINPALDPVPTVFVIVTICIFPFKLLVGAYELNLNNYGFNSIGNTGYYVSASVAIESDRVSIHTNCLSKGANISSASVNVYGIK